MNSAWLLRSHNGNSGVLVDAQHDDVPRLTQTPSLSMQDRYGSLDSIDLGLGNEAPAAEVPGASQPNAAQSHSQPTSSGDTFFMNHSRHTSDGTISVAASLPSASRPSSADQNAAGKQSRKKAKLLPSIKKAYKQMKGGKKEVHGSVNDHFSLEDDALRVEYAMMHENYEALECSLVSTKQALSVMQRDKTHLQARTIDFFSCCCS